MLNRACSTGQWCGQQTRQLQCSQQPAASKEPARNNACNCWFWCGLQTHAMWAAGGTAIASQATNKAGVVPGPQSQQQDQQEHCQQRLHLLLFSPQTCQLFALSFVSNFCRLAPPSAQLGIGKVFGTLQMCSMPSNANCNSGLRMPNTGHSMHGHYKNVICTSQSACSSECCSAWH